MNQFQTALWFYESVNDLILQSPPNEWAIDPYAWDGYITMTPIESAMWENIREANAVMYPQYPVGKFFVDFANPVAKVAIECDGAAFHMDKAKDAARDHDLQKMGWVTYRISGRECNEQFDEETMTIGVARKFIDIICNRHDVKRYKKRDWVSLSGAPA